MSLLRRISAVAVAGISTAICGFSSPSSGKVDVPILVTAAPRYSELAALRGAERFPNGAHLLLFKNGDTKSLLPEFAASADASVSFDATHVLFAGKKATTDPWSIWELTLADGSVRQVVQATTNLIRPFYLPDDSLVYARRTAQGFQVEAAHLDATHVVPLTHIRSSAIPAEVLADGRILFEAGFPLGLSIDHGAKPEMYLVYPDGSGVESYRCDHAATPRWGGRQLASGDVVFTHGAALARFTSALAHEAPQSAPHAHYASGVVELPTGEWLVSERSGSTASFSLAILKPASLQMHPVLSRVGESLVDPVLLAPRTPPRAHPFALRPWDYANLLVLDARQSREGALKTMPAKVRLETADEQGKPIPLGTAPVASDGSFFIKVPPDTPIRMALLDAKGNTLRAEHGWFWMPKGEQRICVGCHAGPERASENAVPKILLRTTTSFDLTGAHAGTTPGGH